MSRIVYDEAEWTPIDGEDWYVTTWWRSKGLVRKQVYRDHRSDCTVAYRDSKGRLVYTFDAYPTEEQAIAAIRLDVTLEVGRARAQLELARARCARATTDWQRAINAGYVRADVTPKR